MIPENWDNKDVILRAPFKRLESISVFPPDFNVEYCKNTVFQKGFKYLNLHKPETGWVILEGFTGVHPDHATHS